jgi:hypothetical protein
MLHLQKKTILKITPILLIVISILGFVIYKNSYKNNLPIEKNNGVNYLSTNPSEVDNNLEKLQLQNSLFKDVREQYLLLGQTRSEIERKFQYAKIITSPETIADYKERYPDSLIDSTGGYSDETLEIFALDDCTSLTYKNNRVNQIRSLDGGTLVPKCLVELELNKNERTAIFGAEEGVESIPGIPLISGYMYTSKGFTILKEGSLVHSIWLTLPLDKDEYNKFYGGIANPSPGFLFNYPIYAEQLQYDSEGRLVEPSIEE